MISNRAMPTLDDFIPKPLTRRTEKFTKLCEFYIKTRGKAPESGYQVFDFIHEHKLPFDLKHFKLLSQEQILSVFWKWQRIMGIQKVRV
ncbi:MAG: hypothetical protein AMDU1_APLC00005G0066 [Thermoplasmatales archaeon A-plasma]|jgi:hypothetical protein|nr:MAG: hypothetical protein AMDU1_APLC00005G0066 [Thermoplasmatales archaeon A-plasma]